MAHKSIFYVFKIMVNLVLSGTSHHFCYSFSSSTSEKLSAVSDPLIMKRLILGACRGASELDKTLYFSLHFSPITIIALSSSLPDY